MISQLIVFGCVVYAIFCFFMTFELDYFEWYIGTGIFIAYTILLLFFICFFARNVELNLSIIYLFMCYGQTNVNVIYITLPKLSILSFK